MKEMERTCQEDFDMSDIIKKSLANTTSTLMTGKPAGTDDSERLWELNDTIDQLVSGLGFVLDFVPIVRMLPGMFGNMCRKAIAERDLFLNKFYFSVKNAASEADSGKQDEQGMVKIKIKIKKLYLTSRF